MIKLWDRCWYRGNIVFGSVPPNKGIKSNKVKNEPRTKKNEPKTTKQIKSSNDS